MPELADLLTPADARALFARHFTPRPRGTKRVPLTEASGRVLARDIVASEDLPEFDRSTVDGFAVWAGDTSKASKDRPAVLTLVGDVQMGALPTCVVQPGATARIATGGMLPEGADAVVMLEDVEARDSRTAAVMRPARPGDNVIRRAEDAKRGEVVLRRGMRLRPQDVGLLAAIGDAEVEVFLKPRVAIIVTGDEIVPPERKPGAGQVRDVNTYTLTALIQQEGGAPRPYGIVEDSFHVLLRTLADARKNADLVLVSGGSSVGVKDEVARAIDKLGKPGVIVHGVSLKPGKPTILAVVEETPIIGLPGHPVSSMVVFDVFVRDLIRGLAGRTPARSLGKIVRARADRRIPAAGVREDHIRVALEERDGAVWAVPVLGKSGIITTMTKADGVVVVPLGRESIEQGAEVEVHLFES
jgi:molybdopterin molybdotransferase